MDPIISLVFSIHSNKGVYALLLGSGVSRSSGIPTGWEIVLDLIRKIAHVQGEDCEPDPAAWYEKKFKQEPDYAKLLDAIAKSASERSQLLRDYFEPNEDDREQGLKEPTKAHKAISELILNGYVKIIITTNFDRLLEKSLETAGITPTVISTPDAADGALPFQHTACTIVKVHGDYLDTRIKNTPEELADYDERINTLLDKILDEFGLIICGWSAEWDEALSSAIERCKNRRFTTYWATRGTPSEKAQKLIDFRQAQVISIKDADSFFTHVAEKISALDDYSKPHPLSTKLAVTSLKKYLVDDRHKIRLHDLVMQETENLCEKISDKNFPVKNISLTKSEVELRMNRYESLSEMVLAMMITGCFWGEKRHEYLWIKCLERVLHHQINVPGTSAVVELGKYPALLLLYGGGIASIAERRYENFLALLTKTKIRKHDKDLPAIFYLHTWSLLSDPTLQKSVYGMKYTPISDQLYKVLRKPFQEIFHQDNQYERSFDRFEYLQALVHFDLRVKYNKRPYFPIGSFGWKCANSPEQSIIKDIEVEVSEEGDDWPLLKAGLFDGSLDRFLEAKKAVDEDIFSRGYM